MSNKIAWLVKRPDGLWEIHTMSQEVVLSPTGKGMDRDEALRLMKIITDECNKRAVNQN